MSSHVAYGAQNQYAVACWVGIFILAVIYILFFVTKNFNNMNENKKLSVSWITITLEAVNKLSPPLAISSALQA